MLMKDAFEVESHRHCKTVVFANVSPSVADLSMTLNTLRYIKFSQRILLSITVHINLTLNYVSLNVAKQLFQLPMVGYIFNN